MVILQMVCPWSPGTLRLLANGSLHAASDPLVLCWCQDVVAISARPYGQRAVLKFAQYTGCLSIAGRFTPGTFTNQITKQFREPRLLIITDPRPDAQVEEATC